jgi:hypothetical protein
LAKAGAQPIDSEWLMLTITDLLPKGAIVVDEALTTAASLAAFLPMRDRYAYFGNVSGGARILRTVEPGQCDRRRGRRAPACDRRSGSLGHWGLSSARG